MKLSKVDERKYALLGAQSRLEALWREETQILASFPELVPTKRGRPAVNVAVNGHMAAAPAAAPVLTSRKPYRMSAKNKAAVSKRMKKYWAERRRQQAHA